MMAEFDRRVAISGPPEASRWLMGQFVETVDIRGTERIPTEGPVLIATNHPGAYDGFIIMSSLPRKDLKMPVSGVPFLRALPAASQHVIYVTPDTLDRMSVIRTMVRHLESGGLVITFATGLVDPDPDLEPGAERGLDAWSPSLEIALRQVPATRLVPTIVSGVLSEECSRSALTRLPKAAWEKRKLAEFLQISEQLAFGRRFRLSPRVTFGQPVTLSELRSGSGTRSAMPAILACARAVLGEHRATAALGRALDIGQADQGAKAAVGGGHILGG
jgi:hypothetical protein